MQEEKPRLSSWAPHQASGSRKEIESEVESEQEAGQGSGPCKI